MYNELHSASFLDGDGAKFLGRNRQVRGNDLAERVKNVASNSQELVMAWNWVRENNFHMISPSFPIVRLLIYLKYLYPDLSLLKHIKA